MSRKEDDDDRCEHLKSGKSDPSCHDSLQTGQEWHDFKTNIDTITNLRTSEIPDNTSVRVMTRSQSRKEPVAVVSNWFSGNYSPKELEVFQREDPDLGKLLEWKELGTCPDRDQGAQYSPAVLKYWLNFSLIVKVEGVLYQKILIQLVEQNISYLSLKF
jgi:hypothetical protein